MAENSTLVIDWEPIGTGGKARLVVTDDAGQMVDIDTADLSRTADRECVARRLASRLRNEPMADHRHSYARRRDRGLEGH